MTQMRIFVSHSSTDNTFCAAIVNALTDAGADVWYDDQSMGAGHLLDVIQRELRARSVFIVILSKAAFTSQWVTDECQWAFNLTKREPDRVILPITAQPIEPSDFNTWLFLEDYKRIEAPGYQPLPLPEAISQTLKTLVLTPSKDAQPVGVTAAGGKSTGRSVLWVDDNPSNTFYERRVLQQHGITFTLSTSTDDALGKLIRYPFDAIISDMGRPPDRLAGYTLLEWAHKINNTVPFILYCPTRPEFKEESKRRGALGQTSSLDELFSMLQAALNLR
jgi:CheY-like chemotaxis protein